MPILVIFQRVLDAFKKGAKKLHNWNELVFLEELVLLRARSGFLVKWFGTHLPVDGLELRVAIANVGDLRSRFSAVSRSRAAKGSGLNLTEPIAGIAGAVAGAAISPTGLILITFAKLQKTAASGFERVLLAIVSTLIWPLVAPAEGASFLLRSLKGESDETSSPTGPGIGRLLTQGYQTMGALSELLDAAIVLVNQLLGPRSGVKNPLVRRLLEIFDRAAALAAQLAGSFSLFFSRSAGVLTRLAREIPLFFALAKESFLIIAEVLRFVARNLAKVVSGDQSPLRAFNTMFKALKLVVDIVVGVLDILFMDAIFRFGDWWDLSQVRLEKWWEKVGAILSKSLLSHPAGAALTAAFDRFDLASTLFASAAARAAKKNPPKKKKASKPGLFDEVQKKLTDWAAKQLRIRDLLPPPLPSLPDTKKIEARAGGAPSVSLSGESIAGGMAMRALGRSLFSDATSQALGLVPPPLGAGTTLKLEEARSKPNLFATRLQALKRSETQALGGQLGALAGEELRHRQHLYAIVADVLPRKLSLYLPELDDVFQIVDREIYGKKPASLKRDFEPPVQAILESRRLQPVVNKLRVRVDGPDDDLRKNAANNWVDTLKEAINQQSYLAPAN